MKAVVLAGGDIESDSLLTGKFEATKKSLVMINGKPMVQWVIDALCEAQSVDQIFLVGLDESDEVQSRKPVVYLQDTGGLLENMRAGAAKVAALSGKDELIFIVSSDIPGLKGHMVDWLAGQIEDERYDLYYCTAPKEVIEKTFPGSNRSYIKFKDVSICGGDINIFNTGIFKKESPLWKGLTDARKNALKQAGMIGFGTLLLVLLKVITLETTARRVCRKLNFKGKPLLVPYAEMAMDVDKPHQFTMMEEYLKGQTA